MKKDTWILPGISGFVLGIFFLWFLIFIANRTNTPWIMGGYMRGNQAVMQRVENIDKHFIEQMIPHHDDAIVMAKLAVTNAKLPEVKQLAQQIISSQGKEIEQMKDWYRQWFGEDLLSGDSLYKQHGMRMHMGRMGNETDIKRLEQAEDFDRVFLEEMIPHHQMAVMMGQMLLRSTTRPEMKKLAEDIMVTQTNEIDQMRKWLYAWDEK